MLEEAYSFGLTPREAYELTLEEMAIFINANRRRATEQTRIMANIAYNAGIVASMSLAKTRPRFEDLFYFKEQNQQLDVENHKRRMIAFAEQINRIGRKREKGG